MKLFTARELALQIKISTRTMHRLRSSGAWEEGIHYFKISPSKILYNLDLINDWIANLHQLELHEAAIANFLSALPSNDRPQRKPNKKAAVHAAQGVKNV
ncbi:MAG: excisionase family protein [Alkalinema sp. FL-bin-369]|nr:excisionase family protein [Leptolyngbyaceae cyanobacterium LF-bin-369]